MWDVNLFRQIPKVFECTHLQEDGVRPLFFESVNYHGCPTRVFAWIGLPEGASANAKVPGIVLVHGGGGTAFHHWVKLWNSRGYAAIAMDNCGAMPPPKNKIYGGCVWPRHDWSGPQGWGGFDQMDDDPKDHWTYHAVSAVAGAHSLLASLEEVDECRIGITGVSWGGVLSCLSASVDPRYKCAAPVYGCGFLTENSAWMPNFETIGPEKTEFWRTHWDPSAWLSQAKCSMLWYNGSNDFAFFPSSWQKSALLTQGESRLCMKLRWPHGHGAMGESMNELAVFMDAELKGSLAYPRIRETAIDHSGAVAKVDSASDILGAQLLVTFDDCHWPDREWHSLNAEWNASSSEVRGRMPEGVKAAYLQLLDERHIYLSSRRSDFTD